MNPANLFSHDTDTTNLAPGEILFSEGETGNCMYVLLEGSVDVIVGGKSVEHSTRGAIIGELALIDQSPRTATVVAKDAAKLARVDEKRFNFMVGQNPFFATHVMKVLADRLRHMNKLQAGLANS
jgi:CRP/FNR family transcriptional regulator, cyclic AMP receptor protein